MCSVAAGAVIVGTVSRASGLDVTASCSTNMRNAPFTELDEMDHARRADDDVVGAMVVTPAREVVGWPALVKTLSFHCPHA